MQFVERRTREDLDADALLLAGVKYEVQIVGEALNQLARLDPALASRIPDLLSIVGLSNILVHGYAKDVPAPRTHLQALLSEASE